MNPVSIEYRIELEQDHTEVFEFELDNESFDLITEAAVDPPPWTELTYRQCSHCPLDPEQDPYCPMALQVSKFVERFNNTRSIDKVKLEVVTQERKVIQSLAIQNVIASMLGLVSPICGCPKTAYMKPMARFHLPLASEEETIFRVTGMYLLSQYFLSTLSEEASIDFTGLRKIYEDLHIVNAAIASRLQSATQSDSVKNAITLLDMYSMLVPMLLDDQLAEMRGFFKAYFPEGAMEAALTNHLESAKAFNLELVPKEDGQSSELPDWLRAVAKTEVETPEVEEEVEPPRQSEPLQNAADEILGKSSLDMALEPKTEKGTGEAGLHLEGTKAVFKLPDD